MTNEIVFGKNVIESLSIGMYSDPLTIFREYIQNAADAIDNAIKKDIIKKGEGTIKVNLDRSKRLITIEDNGTGIPLTDALSTLRDVGNSKKDYRVNKGFRGIGRLGGLGCSERLIFETTCKGESQKTRVIWDCKELLRLLDRDNSELTTASEVITRITSTEIENEKIDAHYFKVVLENIFEDYDELLSNEIVSNYLSQVAPIPFDAQLFSFSSDIRKELNKRGISLSEYYVTINSQHIPIYKKYKNTIKTGHQERTKKNDYIRDVKFIYSKGSAKPQFVLWYGVTNFYGSVSDPYMQGVRIRKGNILVGDNHTFSKYFSSEGDNANSWFVGELHVLDERIIPNSKRDDFERNDAYDSFAKEITSIADSLNHDYRRSMSAYNSATKAVDESIQKLHQIEEDLREGVVTSDTKRQSLLEDRKEIQNTLGKRRDELQKIVNKNGLEEMYILKAQTKIEQIKKIEPKVTNLESQILASDYVTKFDLPSFYSRSERRIYQRIIQVIDKFFIDDKEKAENLHKLIRDELSNKSRNH